MESVSSKQAKQGYSYREGEQRKVEVEPVSIQWITNGFIILVPLPTRIFAISFTCTLCQSLMLSRFDMLLPLLCSVQLFVAEVAYSLLPLVHLLLLRADHGLAVALSEFLGCTWRLLAVKLHQFLDVLEGLVSGHSLVVHFVVQANLVQQGRCCRLRLPQVLGDPLAQPLALVLRVPHSCRVEPLDAFLDLSRLFLT